MSLFLLNACAKPTTPIPDLIATGWTLPPQSVSVDGQPLTAAKAWAALPNAQHLVVRLQRPRADDALVLIGGALYHGVPTAFLIDQETDLPWFLREAEKSYPGQLFRFLRATAASDSANQAAAQFAVAQRKPQASAPTQFDTFLGCMMSGLTPEQYEENRSHLLAIDQGLKARGLLRTFCEAIAATTQAEFGTPAPHLVADIDALRASHQAVFYAYDSVPRMSSMWVEAGAVVAAGIPALFLISQTDALPPLLQSPHKNVELCVYGTHATLLTAWAPALAPASFTCPSLKSP